MEAFTRERQVTLSEPSTVEIDRPSCRYDVVDEVVPISLPGLSEPVNAPCHDLRRGGFLTIETGRGETVTPIEARERGRWFTATIEGEAALVEVGPEIARTETITFPGSCNLQPEQRIPEDDFYLVITDRPPARIPVRYAAVGIDETCESPEY